MTKCKISTHNVKRVNLLRKNLVQEKKNANCLITVGRGPEEHVKPHLQGSLCREIVLKIVFLRFLKKRNNKKVFCK
jgi:hypothetical protein